SEHDHPAGWPCIAGSCGRGQAHRRSHLMKHRERRDAMSTTPTPASTTAGTFLGRQPLLWTAAIRSSLWALVITEVINLTDVQLGAVMFALAAILYLLSRTVATPNVAVVERTADGGDVVAAGHGNEVVPAGTVSRRVGAEVVTRHLATLEA